MKLVKYKSKRKLKKSPEPPAKIKKKKSDQLVFVIQEHHARRLHYDLRLELGGVLKSWAVPKRPSADPRVKRLAIQVEDHPYAYKDFEGTIPEGYGKGTVSIWDRGTYNVEGQDAKASEKSMREGIKKGSLHFTLEGKKLKGDYHLVKMKRADDHHWLLMKKKSEKTEVPNLTNLDKIYWPKEKITKGDLLSYYAKIAPWILPYLIDRPESLRRFPDGIDGKTFFQKNVKDTPGWIETEVLQHRNKRVRYLLIQNEESLLYAANLGCIEMHPFFSRIGKLEYPDYLILDLDPKEAPFEKVVETARAIHTLLEEIEVPSYCKTSGATGLHIAIPLGAKYIYETAEKFAELIANIVQKRIPKIATLQRSLSKRKGKVYIDCHQNHLGQTLAAPYSARARAGAPVSTPLEWKEVKKGLNPNKFTIKTIFSRLKKKGDLFAPVLEKGIDIPAAVRRLQQI